MLYCRKFHRLPGLTTLLIAACLGATAVAQATTGDSAPQETQDQQERQRLVENPYDFSQPPVIPDVEVPSSLDVQQAIEYLQHKVQRGPDRTKQARRQQQRRG